MTKKHLYIGALTIVMLIVTVPLKAQDSDPGLESRVEALEQRIEEQQSEFEAQRELLERTIREQQKNLEAQQQQLSAQYELIQQLKGDRLTET